MHTRAGTALLDIAEIHGRLTDLFGRCLVQCCRGANCNSRVWPLASLPSAPEAVRDESLPRCPNCQRPARVNLLSFRDAFCLVEEFTLNSPARAALSEFADRKEPLLILEIGVGDAVLTVRDRARRSWRENTDAVLVRINPQADCEPLPERYCDLRMGAAAGLQALADELCTEVSA